MNAPVDQRPQSHSSPRPILIALGVIVAVIGIAALVGGGMLVGAHGTQRDGDGFYSTKAHTLTTPTRAFVSQGLDIGSGGPNWFFHKGRLATVRITATGSAAKPVFIGIARSAQLGAYLRNVAQDEITDFEVDPFSVTRVRHAGPAAVPAPTEEHFWAVSATGSGRQDLRWSVRKGAWGVVVMNADGSPHVATDISVGAKVPIILWLGIGLLSIGALFLLGGGTALHHGMRPRRQTASPPAAASPHASAGGRP